MRAAAMLAAAVLAAAACAGAPAKPAQKPAPAAKTAKEAKPAPAPKPDPWTWFGAESLGLEGRAFSNLANPFDRLPANLTSNVNGGVRAEMRCSAGMQLRFATDSRKLVFKWTLATGRISMYHMASTGTSGIDVYRYDKGKGRWFYVATGSADGRTKAGRLEIAWKPGEACIVNLPLYNGVKSFSAGVEKGARVDAAPPHAGGIAKPVVFYGSSITQGACASRPGMAYVNIVGRELDIPVVNLGFSGSCAMEMEMCGHVAAIDASCYVLDGLWNMGSTKDARPRPGRNVEENYEPFVRRLRALRPGVPIVMAGMCEFGNKPENNRDKFVRGLYGKLLAEGWKDVYFIPKSAFYPGDGEETVDGIHPNDWGMKHIAAAFEAALRRALALKPGK